MEVDTSLLENVIKEAQDSKTVTEITENFLEQSVETVSAFSLEQFVLSKIDSLLTIETLASMTTAEMLVLVAGVISISAWMKATKALRVARSYQSRSKDELSKKEEEEKGE